MSTFDKIKSRLEKYPQVTYKVEGNCISIDPVTEHGFSVWLTVNNPGFTVGFDCWHEEFDEESEALSAWTFGLSDRCRLKVIKRGNTDCRWIVERIDEDGTTMDSETGLFLVPFWRKKSVEYRQNKVIQVHG